MAWVWLPVALMLRDVRDVAVSQHAVQVPKRHCMPPAASAAAAGIHDIRVSDMTAPEQRPGINGKLVWNHNTLNPRETIDAKP